MPKTPNKYIKLYVLYVWDGSIFEDYDLVFYADMVHFTHRYIPTLYFLFIGILELICTTILRAPN